MCNADKTERSKRGRRSRRKGASFERWVVRRFREVFGTMQVRRGFQSRSGREAPDVDTPHFWIECKREKSTNPKSALQQAADAARKGYAPLAVCKDDRREPIVALYLEDFIDLIREWWQLKQM